MPDKRKLTVTSCKQVYSGTAKTGRPFTIYEVEALTEAGEPVQERLNSFDDLTPLLGQLVEFEVTFRDHEKYGRTFTLKPPAEVRRAAGEQVHSELAGRVERLEAQVEHLMVALREKGVLAGASAGGQAIPGVQSQPVAAPVAAAPDDDIPFLWRPGSYEEAKLHVSRW